MKVNVVSRSGREVIKGGIQLDDSATVWDLQLAIHGRTDSLVLTFTAKKYGPSRQRLTLPLQPGTQGKLVVLDPKKTLAGYCYGNTNNLTVVFKDLGLQLFDGREGRLKYPRRWVILPPFI